MSHGSPEHAVVSDAERGVVRTSDTSLLERTWGAPSGVIGWFSRVDHKTIGLRFIITSFVFFVLAGGLALLMRLQLALPYLDVLDAETYNQIFTMHGTTMMFFFVVPMLEGIGVYFVPLMIGARETAFPRLNAFSYFLYLIAGIAIFGSLLLASAPAVGWTAYPPLASKPFSADAGPDVWALAVSLVEIVALSQAVTLLVTILKLRAPGMTLARMPVFVWAFLIMAGLVIIAMPALLTTTLMLELDRTAFTKFFVPEEGGDPLLWQHLFWWFGHPDVYIIFIPAFGIAAAVLPAFVRRQIVGRTFVILAIVAIGFINVSVWAHHMFATGMPWLSLGFFSAMTMVVAIPSGVQIFAFLATVWGAVRLRFATPFLFVLAFVVTFVMGGITGVMLAAVPFGLQAHDTHFVVAHLHYVLIGGMVFPMLAGLYYWFPKVTGRLLDDRLGRWNFWLAFGGFHLTFLPMHLTGLWGMPRRVYTFHEGLGLTATNLTSSIGAFAFALSFVLTIVNVLASRRRGREAGPNPWGADSLEWSISSPPPDYNFRVTPDVRSPAPLWTQPELGGTPSETGAATAEEPRTVVELRDDRREALGTSWILAEPESRIDLGSPSIWPFLTAVAVGGTVLGVLWDPWAVPIGAVFVTATIAAWHWPRPDRHRIPVAPLLRTAPIGGATGAATTAERTFPLPALPDWTFDARNVKYLGMWAFIVIEIVMFAAMVMSYFYLRSFEAEWPPGMTSPPDLTLPIVYTLSLLASSVVMWWGEKGLDEGLRRRFTVGLALAVLLATGYLVLKAIEFGFVTSYTWQDHAYGSISWLVSGFHAAHVLTIVIKGVLLLVLALQGHYRQDRQLGVKVMGLYWHFTVLVWIPLFVVLYLTPYWL